MTPESMQTAQDEHKVDVKHTPKDSDQGIDGYGAQPLGLRNNNGALNLRPVNDSNFQQLQMELNSTVSIDGRQTQMNFELSLDNIEARVVFTEDLDKLPPMDALGQIISEVVRHTDATSLYQAQFTLPDSNPAKNIHVSQTVDSVAVAADLVMNNKVGENGSYTGPTGQQEYVPVNGVKNVLSIMVAVAEVKEADRAETLKHTNEVEAQLNSAADKMAARWGQQNGRNMDEQGLQASHDVFRAVSHASYAYETQGDQLVVKDQGNVDELKSLITEQGELLRMLVETKEGQELDISNPDTFSMKFSINELRAISDETITLRKEWAGNDGVGDDYPFDSTQYSDNTGRAIRVALINRNNAAQAELDLATKEVEHFNQEIAFLDANSKPLTDIFNTPEGFEARVLVEANLIDERSKQGQRIVTLPDGLQIISEPQGVADDHQKNYFTAENILRNSNCFVPLAEAVGTVSETTLPEGSVETVKSPLDNEELIIDTDLGDGSHIPAPVFVKNYAPSTDNSPVQPGFEMVLSSPEQSRQAAERANPAEEANADKSRQMHDRARQSLFEFSIPDTDENKGLIARLEANILRVFEAAESGPSHQMLKAVLPSFFYPDNTLTHDGRIILRALTIHSGTPGTKGLTQAEINFVTMTLAGARMYDQNGVSLCDIRNPTVQGALALSTLNSVYNFIIDNSQTQSTNPAVVIPFSQTNVETPQAAPPVAAPVVTAPIVTLPRNPTGASSEIQDQYPRGTIILDLNSPNSRGQLTNLVHNYLIQNVKVYSQFGGLKRIMEPNGNLTPDARNDLQILATLLAEGERVVEINPDVAKRLGFSKTLTERDRNQLGRVLENSIIVEFGESFFDIPIRRLNHVEVQAVAGKLIQQELRQGRIDISAAGLKRQIDGNPDLPIGFWLRTEVYFDNMLRAMLLPKDEKKKTKGTGQTSGNRERASNTPPAVEVQSPRPRQPLVIAVFSAAIGYLRNPEDGMAAVVEVANRIPGVTQTINFLRDLNRRADSSRGNTGDGDRPLVMPPVQPVGARRNESGTQRQATIEETIAANEGLLNNFPEGSRAAIRAYLDPRIPTTLNFQSIGSLANTPDGRRAAASIEIIRGSIYSSLQGERLAKVAVSNLSSILIPSLAITERTDSEVTKILTNGLYITDPNEVSAYIESISKLDAAIKSIAIENRLIATEIGKTVVDLTNPTVVTGNISDDEIRTKLQVKLSLDYDKAHELVPSIRVARTAHAAVLFGFRVPVDSSIGVRTPVGASDAESPNNPDTTPQTEDFRAETKKKVDGLIELIANSTDLHPQILRQTAVGQGKIDLLNIARTNPRFDQILENLVLCISQPIKPDSATRSIFVNLLNPLVSPNHLDVQGIQTAAEDMDLIGTQARDLINNLISLRIEIARQIPAEEIVNTSLSRLIDLIEIQNTTAPNTVVDRRLYVATNLFYHLQSNDAKEMLAFVAALNNVHISQDKFDPNIMNALKLVVDPRVDIVELFNNSDESVAALNKLENLLTTPKEKALVTRGIALVRNAHQRIMGKNEGTKPFKFPPTPPITPAPRTPLITPSIPNLEATGVTEKLFNPVVLNSAIKLVVNMVTSGIFKNGDVVITTEKLDLSHLDILVTSQNNGTQTILNAELLAEVAHDLLNLPEVPDTTASETNTNDYFQRLVQIAMRLSSETDSDQNPDFHVIEAIQALKQELAEAIEVVEEEAQKKNFEPVGSFESERVETNSIFGRGMTTLASPKHPEHNEDRGGIHGNVLFIADGMGGHAGGELAASIANEEASLKLAQLDELSSPEVVNKAFKDWFDSTTTRIRNETRTHGGAAVAVSILLNTAEGKKIYTGWAGDSRVYAINKAGQVILLTNDHNNVSFNRIKGVLDENTAIAINNALDTAQTYQELREGLKKALSDNSNGEQVTDQQVDHAFTHYYGNRNGIYQAAGQKESSLEISVTDATGIVSIFGTSDAIHDNLTKNEIQQIITDSIESGHSWSQTTKVLADKAVERGRQDMKMEFRNPDRIGERLNVINSAEENGRNIRGKKDDVTVVGMAF